MINIDVDAITNIVDDAKSQLRAVKSVHREASDKVDEMHEKVENLERSLDEFEQAVDSMDDVRKAVESLDESYNAVQDDVLG